MKDFRQNIKGRGASSDPANRFDQNHTVLEPYDGEEFAEDEKPLLRTQFFKDASRTILSENKSPDIGFRYSLNCYKGCEHGCAYCYARPTHEYLGMSAGLDFESKIFVKMDAARLLREKFMSRSWVGEQIMMSGNTDCYQPIERRLQLTRSCLEVMAEFGNPVSMITKNALVTRDLDILAPMAVKKTVLVFISVTTLDDELCAVLEPRTSRPAARLRAIRELSQAGVPVGVNVAPCIPGLTDHEMPAILRAAREAGATMAGYTALRLPLTVAPIFEQWLEVHRPLRKDKVLTNIRDMRGGKLNSAEFGDRMRGQGAIAANMKQMFKIYTRKEGLNAVRVELTSEHFHRPGDQLTLW